MTDTLCYQQSMVDLNSKKQALFTHLFLLAFALMGIAYFFITFCQSKIRKRVFNREFMDQFNDEHQAAFGTNAGVGGLPDSGNGYYSAKLSYKDWYDFNNWQRAHMNYLEHFAMVVSLLVIGSVNMPIFSLIAGFLVFVGRSLYAIGYMNGGPKGRIFGALLSLFGLITAFVGAVWSLVIWSNSSDM